MPNAGQARRHMVLVSLAIAVGMGLLGVLLAGSVSRPQRTGLPVPRELGSGDGLTHRLKVDGRDERAQVATRLLQTTLSPRSHGSIEQVAGSSPPARRHRQRVAMKPSSPSTIRTAQRDRTVQVATAIHEMGPPSPRSPAMRLSPPTSPSRPTGRPMQGPRLSPRPVTASSASPVKSNRSPGLSSPWRARPTPSAASSTPSAASRSRPTCWH